MSSVSMFCSWRVTKKPTVVRCCLENNKRADNENLYLISLNGLCNWISFSERVPGTTGFSLANIITPPPHTRWRAFSPRVLLRMRARAHTLRIRKNYIALTARKPWQFFFTTKLSDFKSWKGQGKPAVYVFFFPVLPIVTPQRWFRFVYVFFFPLRQYQSMYYVFIRINDDNNARSYRLCGGGFRTAGHKQHSIYTYYVCIVRIVYREDLTFS